MVQTRSQTREPQLVKPRGSSAKLEENKAQGHPPQKRQAKEPEAKDEGGRVSPKRRRHSHHEDIKGAKREPPVTGNIEEIAKTVLEKYGEPPLQDLVDEKWPASQIVMTHILNAMLSSARISHDIAKRALKYLLDAKYNDLEVLHKTTWRQRADFLSEAGYVRYNEKMATYLGDLTKLMKHKYGTSSVSVHFHSVFLFSLSYFFRTFC